MRAKYITSLAAMAMAAATLVSGCKRENFEPLAAENFDLGNKTFIRFYNAAISSSRNYLYINNTPLTGAAVGYGGLFPSSAGFYSAIDAGQQSLLIKDTAATTTQNQVSISASFDAGKRYTIYTYDTVTTVKYLAVEDVIEVPADTSARVRFVNLPFSRSAVPNVDIFSKRANANIFTNISPTSATDFIPFIAAQADTLYVRPTGTTTNMATLNGFIASRKRSYTLIFRGNYGASSGATARTLASMLTY